MRLTYSDQARDDLIFIYAQGVHRFGEAQADRYLDGLFYLFDLLTDNPRLGTAFGLAIRRINYKSHVVYYEPSDDEIVIAEVRAGRMDGRPL